MKIREVIKGGIWEPIKLTNCPSEKKLEAAFQEYIKGCPEEKNTIIIIVEGGLIQGISTDIEAPINLEVYDFDIFDCGSDKEIEETFGKVYSKSELWEELEGRMKPMRGIY
jgi:hypothetical protein